MADLLDLREFTLPTEKGEKTFLLSKFPAIAGREIITQYPTTAIPKIGDYRTNEDLMLKVMAFVGVPLEGGSVIRLDTRALVDNHVPDWEALMKIEWAMMDYNCAFFRDGRASAFLGSLTNKVLPLITEMLTRWSANSSTPRSQPLKSSKPTTPSKRP